MTSLPINIWGSWGGRSRGREGTVIRAGKSQEWDWGVRTSIRKRKIQMNSSAGFLTVMSAGHWRSLLREIPAPPWVMPRKKMNLTHLDPLGETEMEQFKWNISQKPFCEQLQHWIGFLWLCWVLCGWRRWAPAGIPLPVHVDLLAFPVQPWNILES